MNKKDEEAVMRIYRMLDTRITTINERTKGHTIDLKDILKRLKELEKRGEKR